MHVCTRPTPLIQSRLPTLVSSLARGGIDTVGPVVPVVTAPSMREPPKKHTRWSCFGTIRQVLSGSTEFSAKTDNCERYGHLAFAIALWDDLLRVDQPFVFALPNQMSGHGGHSFFVHLNGGALMHENDSFETNAHCAVHRLGIVLLKSAKASDGTTVQRPTVWIYCFLGSISRRWDCLLFELTIDTHNKSRPSTPGGWVRLSISRRSRYRQRQ